MELSGGVSAKALPASDRPNNNAVRRLNDMSFSFVVFVLPTDSTPSCCKDNPLRGARNRRCDLSRQSHNSWLVVTLLLS